MKQSHTTNHLKGILANKSALQHMDPKAIAKIIDSVKKDYHDKFTDTVSMIPKELLPSILSSLSYKTRIEILANLEAGFLHSIFKFANDEEIAVIMEDLEGVDEGKYKKIFEKLKIENFDLTESFGNTSHGNRVLADDASVKLYMNLNGKIHCVGFDSSISSFDVSKLVWVDMFKPSTDEIEAIEKILGIEIPTINEREEIEVSSRYWEEGGVTTINSYFTIFDNDEVVSETISLILKDNFMVSVRFRNFRSFDELMKKMVYMPHNFTNGIEAMLVLLDIRIDLDADMLEKLVREISLLRKSFILEQIASNEMLSKLSSLEDLNIKMRESLQDKNRILNAFVKNRQLKEVQLVDLRVMIRDVLSLIVHVDFNFERIDSIQNIALAAINIKQGKNITILTIANILFLPPTLIASLYGMNFEFMPELHWQYGYLFALGFMGLSAIAPYWLFKKKGWL
jgi:magnesium transporter